MSSLSQIECEHFLYPLFENPTLYDMQSIFANGLPIKEETLARYREKSWKETTKTEGELSKKKPSSIKGWVVIQIPQMFLFGLQECLSGEVEMNWKGFMPYLKRDTGTNGLNIIPQLIQGIFIPDTLEYTPNPNQSIYYHGEGWLFDQSQIKQMQNLGFPQIASFATRRLSIPYELLLVQDTAGQAFSGQNADYQRILFSDAYLRIRTKYTIPKKLK